MRITLVCCFILSVICTYGNTFFIGTDHEYETPNALYIANVVSDGDTIFIESKTYEGIATLAVWNQNDLVIIGGEGVEKTLLKAEGQYILGKGIWVIAGNNTKIYNIEFQGAIVPDKNGAGIRLDGGSLYLNNCGFFYNEMGLLSNSSPGTVEIEYCAFGYNGYGDGFSHNIYINHMDSLIFRYNESFNAVIGHTLKSRARNNIIEYNLFYDGENGNSSRLIDLPDGGFSLVMGNILIQGENAENNNIIGYGLEGLYDSMINSLYVINNTVINEKTSSGRFLHVPQGPEIVEVYNNIFAGVGTLIDGETTAEGNNLKNEDIEFFDFIENVNGKIYSLQSLSPAINAGTELTSINGYSLIPTKQFNTSLGYEERIIYDGLIDVGAYEVPYPISTHDFQESIFSITPNPVTTLLTIDTDHMYNTTEILSIDGKILNKIPFQKSISIEHLNSGTYYIKLIDAKGYSSIKKFIKL